MHSGAHHRHHCPPTPIRLVFPEYTWGKIPMTTTEQLPPADHYRLIRGQIEFKHTLTPQRLNCFLPSQSFLATAYAITLNPPADGALRADSIQPHTLFHLIPLIALAVCVLIYATVI